MTEVRHITRRRTTVQRIISGFTVIELILALALTAIIGVSLFTVYNNAVRADAQSRRLYDSMIKGYMMLTTFEEDVSKAVNYRYHPSGQSSDQLLFYGETDQLSFVKETGVGLQWIQYTTKRPQQAVIRATTVGQRFKKNQDQILENDAPGGSELQMFIRRQSVFLGKPDTTFAPDNDEIMTKRLLSQGLVFSYGRVSQQGMIWTQRWNDSSLPAAIKVDLKVASDGENRSFDLSKVIMLPASL